MKTMKFFSQTRLFLISVLFITALLSSCKKDEDPEYVGTWIITESEQLGGYTIEYKEAMTLTENSFSDLYQYKHPIKNEWLGVFGVKGTFNLSGKIMNITITEIGESAKDVNEMPTGVMTYYKDGTTRFTELLTENEMVKTFKVEYTVVGNTLTFKIDMNSDGDYTDADDDITVYTKQ